MCKNPVAWSAPPPPPTNPFQGGPRPLFRLEIYSAVSMRFRWRPVRTRRRQSRSKVPEVGSEGHFWRASAPLLEAKVVQCCMCEKHTIYYVLTTLGRVWASCFRLPARLRDVVVTQFVLFPCFSAAWDAMQRPKGGQRGPKASQSHPKSTPKSS